MSSNAKFGTYDVAAREALMRFMLDTPAFGLVDWSKSKELVRTINGYKRGTKVTVARATRALPASDGRKVVATDTADVVKRFLDLSLSVRQKFVFEFTDEQMTFYNTETFGRDFIAPAVDAIVLKADRTMSRHFGNLGHQLGTPGTDITHKLTQQIRTRGSYLGHSLRNRIALVSPEDIDSIGESVANSNPSGQSGIAYAPPDIVRGVIKEAFKGMKSGYAMIESTNLPTMNTAAVAACNPLVNGANQEWQLDNGTLATDGWPAGNNVKVLNAGQIIKIAGVHTISPNSQNSTDGVFDGSDSGLQAFVVLEDVVANNGAANIKLGMDCIGPNTGLTETADAGSSEIGGSDAPASLAAYQNVDAKPADNAIIYITGETRAGSGSTPVTVTAKRYRKSFWYSRQAVCAIGARLEPMTSLVKRGMYTNPRTGMSFGIHFYANGDNAEEKMRGDAVWGARCLNPEAGIQVISAARD